MGENKIGLVALGLLALLADGRRARGAASLEDDISGANFTDACETIERGATDTSPVANKLRATLKRLQDLYPPTLGSPTPPPAPGCQALGRAWSGLRLDLSYFDNPSLLLLSKLIGVVELDLANDGITDGELKFLLNSNTAQHSTLYETLTVLDLSGNRIVGGPDLRFFRIYTKLQRLSLSRNRLTSIDALSLAGTSIVALSVAHNPDLSITSYKEWEHWLSFVSLDASGIGEFDMNAFFGNTPVAISALSLPRVGRVRFDLGQGRCRGAQPLEGLVYLDLAGAGVDRELADDLLDPTKRCFPNLSFVDVTGTALADQQDALNERYPRAAPGAATCSGEIRYLLWDLHSVNGIDVRGNIHALRCEGTLSAPGLGIEGARDVEGVFDSSSPVVYP